MIVKIMIIKITMYNKNRLLVYDSLRNLHFNKKNKESSIFFLMSSTQITK